MNRDLLPLVIDDAVDSAEHCEKCRTFWFPRLHAYLARFNLGEDANDLAQETLIWACQRPTERCKPAALFNYARCRAIDLIRKPRRRVEVSLDAPVGDDDRPRDIADLSLGVEENLIRREEVDRLRNCVEKLPDKRREVIFLYMEDLTKEEIGEVLGIPVATVRSRENKALFELADCMGRKRIKREYTPREKAAVDANQGGKE